MSITKASALRNMNATHHDGTRIPFAIEVITADREKYKQYLRMLEQLSALDQKSAEYELLLDKIKAIDIGGKLLSHHQCVISKPRGIHAAAQADRNSKIPNHSSNRTRNIMLLPSNSIRKIHNSLIVSFNAHEVLY